MRDQMIQKEKPKSKKKTSTLKKPTPKKSSKLHKRKNLSIEDLHPFTHFPFRLEYTDRSEIRICHFVCEEHRNKHIKRYKMRKNQYYIDDFTAA